MSSIRPHSSGATTPVNTFDWSVVGAYLVVVLFIGFTTTRRKQRVFDYFLGSRSFGVFPVALSIIATEVSAATIIGGPDTAYRGNLAYLQTTIGSVLSRVFLAFFFIDVYYRNRVFTVYAYLAQRFDVRTQVLTSLLYVVARVLASGARLYIAGFAIGTIASVNLYVAIGIITVAGVVYCAKGGLPAVIWTDCLQAAVFLGVGCYSVAYVIESIGGAAETWRILASSDKLNFLHFNNDIFSRDFWLNPYTFIGAVIGGFTLGVATHGTDQDNVQRMLACRSSIQARLSLVVAALLEIPTVIIFVGIGSLLWAYYQQAGVTPPPQGESVFPYFIRTAVPEGLRGLFVAGILAAAMSSLNSVLNALASVSVTDLYLSWKRGITARRLAIGREDYSIEQFGAGVTEEQAVRISKWHSIFWGAVLGFTAIGLGLHHQHILLTTSNGDVSRTAELLTLALGVMSTVYGPLLAVFLLAIFTSRGNFWSLALGIGSGLCVTVAMQLHPSFQIGWTWQTVVGCLVTLTIGMFGPRWRHD